MNEINEIINKINKKRVIIMDSRTQNKVAKDRDKYNPYKKKKVV